MESLAVPLIAAVLTRGLFGVLETRWPNDYFGIDAYGAIDPITNRSLWRFLAWRSAPVFVGSAVSSITVERLGGRPFPATWIFLGIYLSLSVLKSVALHGDGPASRRFKVHAVAQGGVGVILAGAAFLGFAARRSVGGAVPEPDVLLASVWTSLLLAAGASALIRPLHSEASIQRLVSESKRELGEELLDYTRVSAAKHGTDPIVAEAVLIAENLQRPRWIRRIENALHRLGGDGTYGAMQVRAAKPLTDKESVDVAMATHLRGAQLGRTSGKHPSDEDVRSAVLAIGSYNRSASWKGLVGRIILELLPQPAVLLEDRLLDTFGSSIVGPDGASFLQVGNVGFKEAFLGFTASVPQGAAVSVSASLRDSAGAELWRSSAVTSEPPAALAGQYPWASSYQVQNDRWQADLNVPAHREGTTILIELDGEAGVLIRFDIPATWRRLLARALDSL